MADDLTASASLASPQSQEPASQYLYQGLISRGFNPAQAAALVGNMRQESSWNPSALNRGEGAIGLIQWENERRTNLENFAQATGRNPLSADTQMDFIVYEMRGAEAKNSAPFLAAQDINSANQALHGYIRYRNTGEIPTRAAYAQQIASGDFTGAPIKDAVGYSGHGASGSAYASLEQSYTPRPPQDFLTSMDQSLAETADKKAEVAKATAAAPKPQGPLIGQTGPAPFGLKPGQPAQPAPQPVPKPMDYYLALLKKQGAPEGAA